ncbi:MAG: response regulator [Bryobacterales bacterium]|nr:response regulator [Bryobacterales bacterium]
MAKRILIADDSAAQRKIMVSCLRGLGLEVLQAEDGEEALSLAIGARPDVVILDWMMPGYSGLEVAARLRDSSDLAEVPIVLVTARDQERDEAAATIAGVTRYLRKPFASSDLSNLVHSLLDPQPTAEPV